ncbi:MAG TPA: hypothetical protein VHN17_03370 [Steroidobacteraceae bacterium]|jgi:hypothetical protein|nr:hypothetical protein [Steroidobacteraceae bacterium]
MIYFLALIPATALTVAGYCVLYVSHRSEGSFRSFGKYLGFWAFTLAGLVILGAIFAAAHAGRYGPMMHARGAHGMMHRPWAADGRFDGPGIGEPPQAMQPGDAPPHPGAPNPAAPNPAPPR